MDAIPGETALQLCAEIHEENRGRWYRFAYLQCWGCITYAKGNPDKMCLSSPQGYRVCNLINKCYAQWAKVRVGQAN